MKINRSLSFRLPHHQNGAIVAPVLLVMVTLGALFFHASTSTPGDPWRELNTVEVRTAPFHKVVEVVGQVRSLNPVDVESGSYWRVRILDIVPEGTTVKSGDVICTLDSSELEEDAREREIRVIRAESQLASSVADQSLQEAVNARRIASAELNALVAQDMFDSWEQAEFQQQLDEMEDRISIDEEEAWLAQDELNYSRELASRGIQSWKTVDRIQYKTRRAERDVDLSRGKQFLLTEFERARKFASLSTSAALRRNDLIRAELLNGLATTKARMSTLNYERRLAIYKRSLQYRLDSIAACTVIAPCDGEVMHANSWSRRSRGYDNDIEVGAEVRYRQDIVSIIDRTRVKVKAAVPDRLVTQLHAGLYCEIHLPGRDIPLGGELTWVSPLSFARSRHTPHIRDHWVEIQIRESPEILATLVPRMDVNVEIIVDSRSSVRQIPANTVVEYENEFATIVRTKHGLQKRVVELGASDDGTVEILSGLNDGDQVVESDAESLRSYMDSL